MEWRRFRARILGGLAAVAIIATGVYLAERHDAELSRDRQEEVARNDLGIIAGRLTRDLVQEVALVQGLVALVSSTPTIDQPIFGAYTKDFRRDYPNLKRVYLVRDGKVLFTDRPAVDAESFARIERALAPSQPMPAAAINQGSAIITGPLTSSQGDAIFIYARPIFIGDGKPSTTNFWGFAGINIDKAAIVCRFGLCDGHPKYNLAMRLSVDGQAQVPFVGDAKLFDAKDDVVRVSSHFPGVEIEVAAAPAAGWIAGAPNRWMIRGIGGVLALFSIGLVLIVFVHRPGFAMWARIRAAVGSTAVLLLVLGIAGVLDRLEGQRAGNVNRDVIGEELQKAALAATGDISDDAAVIQNMTTFVAADPNFTNEAFDRYAERIRQLHPRIVSVRLAKGTVTTHSSPHDPDRIGLDLRANPDEAKLIDESIRAGTPILSGPTRVGTQVDTFVYRKPIFLGDGSPSPDRFWGFATIRIARDAVICPLGVCEQPPKYQYALRLVTGQTPQVPYAGDPALFEQKSGAEQVAIRLPGGRFEMAALPVQGWAGSGGMRWLIWAAAIPLALLASGRLLLVFFGLAAPVLRVWIGVLTMMGAGVLMLLHNDVGIALELMGITNRALVTPVIVALLCFAAAYTINAALAAYVWPQHVQGQADVMQRAPSILRNLVALLLYATAGLWAAAYVFNLDLGAVGLTSGAVGIVVGFAVQRLIADFFSGVMLGIERPFSLGDWIEVNAGHPIKGVLTEMTWRITLVRDSNGDMVSVPNSLLAQATVVNRSRPHKHTDVGIRFAVADTVPYARVAELVKEAVEPLRGSIVLAHPEPKLNIVEIVEGDLKYKLGVYSPTGPGGESTIRTRINERLQTVFAAADVQFSAAEADAK